MRIFLVGYMGSGKTTLGKELARKLGYRYVDIDEMIEKETRKTVHRVFEEKGEERFRNIEKRLLRETKRLFNVVVASGGGAPIFDDNMDWMNQNGISLFLKVSAAELYKRLLKTREERPLIKDIDETQLLETIKTHLVERELFYEKAKHVIKSDKITLLRILKQLNMEQVKPVK